MDNTAFLEKDDEFAKYYMRDEGDLFYWYFIICCVMVAFNLFLIILMGACFFTGGSFFGTKIVEQMIEKVDEIPQQMAEKAAARR